MPTDAEKAAYLAKHYAEKEISVEQKACVFARKLGCWVAKFKSPQNRGAPDRIIITPTGVVFFIEFKRKAKTARAQQKLVIDEMREHGAVVFVTDDAEKAKEIIFDMVTFGATDVLP